MIEKRKEMQNQLTLICFLAFISGGAAIFGSALTLVGIKVTQSTALIPGIVCLVAATFAAMYADRMVRALWKNIKTITATPLEKQMAMREKEEHEKFDKIENIDVD